MVNTIPTIGFNVEEITYNNITFTVWDVAGGDYRKLNWHHYYKNTTGLVFVVGSNDQVRVEENKEEI